MSQDTGHTQNVGCGFAAVVIGGLVAIAVVGVVVGKALNIRHGGDFAGVILGLTVLGIAVAYLKSSVVQRAMNKALKKPPKPSAARGGAIFYITFGMLIILFFTGFWVRDRVKRERAEAARVDAAAAAEEEVAEAGAAASSESAEAATASEAPKMPATTTDADTASADKGVASTTPSFDAPRPTAREKEMYNRTLALYQTGDPYYEEEPEGLSEAESNRWFREYQKKNEQHEARQMAIVAKEFGVSVADVEANWRKCSVYAGSIGKIEEPLLPAD